MDRDRSLDEFAGGESEDSAAPDAAADGDEDDSTGSGIDTDGSSAESGSEPTPDGAEGDDADADATDDDHTATVPDDIEPAAVTYRWEPDGTECAECGTTVEQLWSGESGQVCDECKEW